MKLKTKYAAGMRDELEALLGCPVEVVEDREAKYPCKMGPRWGQAPTEVVELSGNAMIFCDSGFGGRICWGKRGKR